MTQWIYAEAQGDEITKEPNPWHGVKDKIQRKGSHAPKNHLQEGKPMPTLLPMDVLIKYLEPAYREGISKYYRESWRLGFPVSVMIDAALRHITKFFWEHEDYDMDSETIGHKKHHLAGAIFSLLCVLQTMDEHPEMDDRRKLEHLST